MELPIYLHRTALVPIQSHPAVAGRNFTVFLWLKQSPPGLHTRQLDRGLPGGRAGRREQPAARAGLMVVTLYYQKM